mmetsp:Transcript_43170/g.69217  ORF Transcript_43170/g.69217 Transcript_43170/m.69217 type:complete len:308 (-) Transcript_43170:4935-5858(-)
MDVTDVWASCVRGNGGVFEENVQRSKSVGFSLEADTIWIKLQGTKQVIGDVVGSYSEFGSYVGGSNVKGLTDEERDAFDGKIGRILSEERGKIDSLRDGVVELGSAREGSLVAHRQMVVQHLYEFVQEITKMTGELQLLRMRQTVSAKKTLYASEQRDAVIEDLVENEQKLPDAFSQEGLRNRKNRFIEEEQDDVDLSDVDDVFLAELQTEQAALKNQLEEEMEGVKQAEKQMHEFSQLLSLFNDKVMEQSESISNIFNDVQKSTNLMDSATDQLFSAKEHGSSFRKYVVIFFVVASGLLLLLDAMD